MKSIKNSQDTLVAAQLEIEEVFKKYFQNVFQTSHPFEMGIEQGTSGVSNKVMREMNDALTKRFHKTEVELALK